MLGKVWKGEENSQEQCPKVKKASWSSEGKRS